MEAMPDMVFMVLHGPACRYHELLPFEMLHYRNLTLRQQGQTKAGINDRALQTQAAYLGRLTWSLRNCNSIVFVRLKQKLLRSTIELYNSYEALDGKDKINGTA